MFSALTAKDQATADHYRQLMEQIRQQQISNTTLIPINSTKLPQFVKLHLNKNHQDLEITERSNCINAAFNFHDDQTRYSTYTTMDLLNRLQNEFMQIESRSQLQFGDLIVLWSRISDDWKDRKILIKDLNPAASGFPFGVVFDHVAVYIEQNQLFHKPDPTSSSRYQINHWHDVIPFNEVLPGFELTFHRKSARQNRK